LKKFIIFFLFSVKRHTIPAPYIGMSNFYDIFYLARGFLFPGLCALCNAGLRSQNEIKHGLCESCFASLETEQGAKCGLCGKGLISEIETCLPCRRREKQSYDRIFVIFPYTGKYRKLLAAYKFRKNTALAEVFTEKIIDVLGESVLNEAVLVPVPPRPGKIKENGWDQVEYLVKKLEKALPEKKFSRCLKRKKSKVQKKLNRSERLDNLKGRIFINGIAPKTALIIDDVITTGSTMEVCARVLKENGAEKVYGLCLFYD
jgi:ComF family protein